MDGNAPRSGNWLVEARNKKSVTLNLRVEQGQNILRELIAHADVLVENFTPGTLERWGLGWEAVHALNPRLIMVRVSGYGQTGPYSKRAGYDRIALGFSGYMYPTGSRCARPFRPLTTTPAPSPHWPPCLRSITVMPKLVVAQVVARVMARVMAWDR